MTKFLISLKMEYNGLTKDFTNIFKSDGGCYTLSLG